LMLGRSSMFVIVFVNSFSRSLACVIKQRPCKFLFERPNRSRGYGITCNISHREYNRCPKKRIRCAAHFHGFRRSLRQNVIQSYRAICFPVETRRHVHTTHTNRSSLIGLYFMRPEHPSIFRMPPTISINDLTWRSLDYFVKQSP